MRHLILAVGFLCVPLIASAQTIGTLRWQTQPYCNVITVTVTGVGGTYRLEGTDDQCGSSTQASVLGTAFVNPNGSIGIGLSVVGSPGGSPTAIDASISIAAGISGTWSDSAGHSGNFTLISGASTGGPARGSNRQRAFVHTSTIENQAGQCTKLDHPLLNNAPGTILVASSVFSDAVGGFSSPFVLYYQSMLTRWLICSSPSGVPAGFKFHVMLVSP